MPKYKKGQVWNKPKTALMKQFEKETKKNAVYRDKITGNFEYWLWKKEQTTPTPKAKPKPKPKAKSKFKPKVKLSGTDGNAFAIIGRVSTALKKAGLGDQVEKYREEAMSGDYDNVLRTSAKYADIS